MRRIGGLLLAALALTGCASEVVQCGACADPRIVGVLLVGDVPTGVPLRVCVDGLGCQEQAPAGRQAIFQLEDGTDRARLDDRRVTVSARDGATAYDGTGRLQHRAARGDCGCESLTGRATVRTTQPPPNQTSGG
jgi:hypothetical protein